MSRRCVVCGKRHTERRPDGRYRQRCEACRDLYFASLTSAGTVVDPLTRYEDDPAAQLFVSAYPHGATLEEVGEAFGVTRERIRQIEARALQRIAALLGEVVT